MPPHSCWQHLQRNAMGDEVSTVSLCTNLKVGDRVCHSEAGGGCWRGLHLHSVRKAMRRICACRNSCRRTSAADSRMHGLLCTTSLFKCSTLQAETSSAASHRHFSYEYTQRSRGVPLLACAARCCCSPRSEGAGNHMGKVAAASTSPYAQGLAGREHCPQP